MATPMVREGETPSIESPSKATDSPSAAVTAVPASPATPSSFPIQFGAYPPQPSEGLELSPEELRTELTSRLRKLLSRQNISVDPSIALLLTGALWPSAAGEGGVANGAPQEVSLNVDALLRHPAIAVLPVTKEILIESAKAVGPHLLRVDEQAEVLYPVMKAPRSTIILRDLEAEAAELKAFVASAPCLAEAGEAAILEVREEVVGPTHTWFVTLPSAQEATETALWLRTQEYKGASLKVGMKSESAFQSFMTRPNHSYNVEGAFVPNMMNNMVGMERQRKPSGRGGRSFMPRGQRRYPNNTRNWSDARGSVEGARGRGRPRNQRGGNRRPMRGEWNGQQQPPIILGQGFQNKEVDPAEFPALVESAKLCNVGYGTREYRRYTPETLRSFQCTVEAQP